MKRTALLFFLTGMLMLPAAAQEKDSIKSGGFIAESVGIARR